MKRHAIRTIYGCALLFLIMAASQIIHYVIRHSHQKFPPTVDCADYPTIDGAGKPQVCK